MKLSPPDHIKGRFTRRNPAPHADRAEWCIKQVSAGHNVKDIAAALGATPQMIYTILKRASIPLPRKHSPQKTASKHIARGSVNDMLVNLSPSAFSALFEATARGETAVEVMAALWEQHHGGGA